MRSKLKLFYNAVSCFDESHLAGLPMPTLSLLSFLLNLRLNITQKAKYIYTYIR
jgi:hypothetical protein